MSQQPWLKEPIHRVRDTPMKQTHVHWTPPNTPGEWHATIQDIAGRTWNVAIYRNSPGFGCPERMTATMICATAGVFKSNSMLTTLIDAQNWCYQELGSAGQCNDSVG
jgi:hypothetical protein